MKPAGTIIWILLLLVGIGPVAYGQQEADDKHATPDKKQQDQKREQQQQPAPKHSQ